MMQEKIFYHQPAESVPIVVAMASEDVGAIPSSTPTDEQATSNSGAPPAIASLPIHEAQVVTIDEPESEATPLVMSQPQRLSNERVSSVSSPSEHHRQSSTSVHDESIDYGPKPNYNNPTQFRDWPFAVVFWIHIAVILYVGITYSSAGYSRVAQDFNWTQMEQQIAESDDVSPEDLKQFESFMEDAFEWVQGYSDRILWYSKFPAAIAAMIFVDITLTLIRPCTATVVTTALIGSMTLVVGGALAVFIAQPSIFGFLLTCLVVGAGSFFTCTVWPLRSFVSINLKVSLEGLAHNLGTYLWAIFFSYVCVAWVVFWFYTLFGLSFLIHIRCEDRLHPEEKVHLEKDSEDDCNINGGIFLLLVLSLYWTTNVIINYLRCTIAGVMATWLYAKEDARCCCSSAVWGSLMRGATYSFGSICFGSLVQGFVAFLRCVISSAKRNRDSMNNGNETGCCGGLCFCIVDCIANFGGDALEYFSQWNYIYIALYGFTYIESGKAVMRLFRFKGWQLSTRGSMSIISERLTSYVLGSISIAMGILTGVFALVIERIVTWCHPDSEYDSYVYGPLPHWRVFTFL
jgi:Plasma-membrane choline transporter